MLTLLETWSYGNQQLFRKTNGNEQKGTLMA